MGQIIGIDLGTTNSVMARWRRKGPECVRNAEDETLTPSAVMAYKSQLYVGKEARELAKADSKNAIFSIKRFMGREFRDEPVQEAIRRVAYEVHAAQNGEIEVTIGGKAYTPVEISAKILKKLKEDAERAIGEEVTHAVITVPAYFGQKQKNATREAGKLAGLHVMRVITEPTAAALAYGVDVQNEDSQTLLVYDFGGGTLDISILQVSGGNFDVRHIEGDNFLGGDDLDYCLVDYILSEVKRSTGVNLADNRDVRWTVKPKAEEAKIRLSQHTSTHITLPSVARKSNGTPIDIDLEIKRERFEELIGSLVDRSVDLVRKAMRDAEFSPADIDRVLLVGGTTKIPVIERRLKEIFGDKIDKSINPMECVALGAAVQTTIAIEWLCDNCHAVNDGKDENCSNCGRAQYEDESEVAYIECSECGSKNRHGRSECWQCGKSLGATIMGETVTNFERTGKSIGVEAARDKRAASDDAIPFHVVIPKGTQYPTNEPLKVEMYTQRANQTYVYLPVREGEDLAADKNELIGVVEAEDFPPGLPANTPVTVEMRIDGDGILYVSACLTKQPEVRAEARFDWAKKQEAEKSSESLEDSVQFKVQLFTDLVRLFGNYMVDDVRQDTEYWLRQAKVALQTKDAAKLKQVDHQFDELRKRVGGEWTLLWAKILTEETTVATTLEQQQARQMINQIDQDVRNGNIDGANKTLAPLRKLTDELANRLPDGRLKRTKI
jgi:molecular chaperone DnaK (HSP70)